MAVFAQVVDCAGFSEAGRRLGLTRSAVSRQIALLEEALGVRLLNRTTRRLSLTEAGERYYRSCAHIVAEAEAADRAVRNLHDEPIGTLKVNGPVVAHSFLVDAIGLLMARHSALAVELALDDAYIDLIASGVDVAVRIGHPGDSTLIARKLASIEHAVVGAPSYFEAHGVPRQPSDLLQHQWLVYSLLSSPNRLVFTRGAQRVPVRVDGRLRINGGPAIRDAAAAGLGLVCMPSFYVAEYIERGRLQAVLTDWHARRSDLFAVYAHRERLPSKVRVFVDTLREMLANHPAFRPSGEQR